MFGFAVEGVATFPAAFSFSTGAKSICCAVVSSLSCNARGREIVRFDGNDVCLAACKVECSYAAVSAGPATTRKQQRSAAGNS